MDLIVFIWGILIWKKIPERRYVDSHRVAS